MMAKTQAKMKEYLAQQTNMNSFERLSKTLGNDTMDSSSGINQVENDKAVVTSTSKTTITTSATEVFMEVEGSTSSEQPATTAAAASSSSSSPTTTTTSATPVENLRGENKAIPKRKMSRKQKHVLMAKKKKFAEKKEPAKERPKPRFFCQF